MVKKLPKDLDIFSLSTAGHMKGIGTMLGQAQTRDHPKELGRYQACSCALALYSCR